MTSDHAFVLPSAETPSTHAVAIMLGTCTHVTCSRASKQWRKSHSPPARPPRGRALCLTHDFHASCASKNAVNHTPRARPLRPRPAGCTPQSRPEAAAPAPKEAAARPTEGLQALGGDATLPVRKPDIPTTGPRLSLSGAARRWVALRTCAVVDGAQVIRGAWRRSQNPWSMAMAATSMASMCLSRRGRCNPVPTRRPPCCHRAPGSGEGRRGRTLDAMLKFFGGETLFFFSGRPHNELVDGMCILNGARVLELLCCWSCSSQRSDRGTGLNALRTRSPAPRDPSAINQPGARELWTSRPPLPPTDQATTLLFSPPTHSVAYTRTWVHCVVDNAPM